ncbi:MAG: alpha-galactosidase [Clostridia bacterium]|nr:alpha-galactosidase [Clostridia bacterium]
MNTRTTKADMLLTEKLFLHPALEPETAFDRIPLTWTFGGEVMHGIPAKFRRSYTREIVDANITRYTYTGVCGNCGFEIKAVHDEYRDYPVSEWMVCFTNHGTKDTPILSDVKLGGEIRGDFEAFIYGNGDTLRDNGYEWFADTLENGARTIHPTDGTSCTGAFPYMNLAFDSFIVRAAVGWPHMWTATAEKTAEGVRYTCGQLRCNMVIHPGETMRTPRLTLMISEGDDNRSTNLWRRWYMDHICPREFGKPIEPMLCMHYFEADGKPEFTGASEENQLAALREYVSRGITPDIWWVDAGWYKCDEYWPHIGTWKPDEARFPNGFAPLGEECDKNDIRFLLWFEPERAVTGTELYNEHIDWLLPTGREGDANHLVNLGCRETCDWIIERVDSIIKEGHIRVYRQDFNFDPKPCWEKVESEDRIGAMENLHVQGYLRFWDALIERNPGLWIDSCASGGRRNDLETMRRAVTLHYTDVGYGAHTIKQKQHRQMHEWIPYFRAHNMSWDKEDAVRINGEWVENDMFSFQNAMVPSITCMTKYDADDGQYERSKTALAIWRRAAEYALEGDYYPLTECRKDPADWYAVQFDNNGKGYVQFIRNIRAQADSLTVLPFAEEGKTYRFTNSETGEEFTKTAEELKAGLTVTLPLRTGVVYFYEAE